MKIKEVLWGIAIYGPLPIGALVFLILELSR